MTSWGPLDIKANDSHDLGKNDLGQHRADAHPQSHWLAAVDLMDVICFGLGLKHAKYGRVVTGD